MKKIPFIRKYSIKNTKSYLEIYHLTTILVLILGSIAKDFYLSYWSCVQRQTQSKRGSFVGVKGFLFEKREAELSIKERNDSGILQDRVVV